MDKANLEKKKRTFGYTPLADRRREDEKNKRGPSSSSYCVGISSKSPFSADLRLTRRARFFIHYPSLPESGKHGNAT